MVIQVGTVYGRWIVNKLTLNSKIVAWIPVDSLIFVALKY